MIDRPLILPGHDARAVLDGRKTQHRVPVTAATSLVYGSRWTAARWALFDFSAALVDAGPSPAGNAGPYLQVPSGDSVHRVYPRTQPGDRWWVQEWWLVGGIYRADGDDAALPWRSPSSMPRHHSRLTLVVTSVRVERLLDITEEDAQASVVDGLHVGDWVLDGVRVTGRPWAHSFLVAWDRRHGKRAPWASNPWVWAWTLREVKEAEHG